MRADRCPCCNSGNVRLRETFGKTSEIGRVCAQCRKCGLSTRLVKFAAGDQRSRLAAQEHALRLWNMRGGARK